MYVALASCVIESMDEGVYHTYEYNKYLSKHSNEAGVRVEASGFGRTDIFVGLRTSLRFPFALCSIYPRA